MKLLLPLLSVTLGADICYTYVGCFTDDPPFSVPGYRPARLPSSPDSVVTSFRLTNKVVRDKTFDWKNPTSGTSFTSGRNVMVMTHGWTAEWDSKSWLNDARDAFRSNTNDNFVGVDWSGGSQILDYVQAAANTQSAGRAIAHMFNELKTKEGFRASQFQCAGHSLGGHVCSYAAKYTKSEFGFTIDRVTGLDAAGPLFEKTTSAVRIDKSDASFVDLIHTNGGNEDAGFLGINAAVGHADFFPNGGHQQPKCNNNFACSHGEAPYIFIDSVNNNGCVFTKCSSEQDYLNGKCNRCSGTDCNTMGYSATKPSRDSMYYGNTSSGSPYC